MHNKVLRASYISFEFEGKSTKTYQKSQQSLNYLIKLYPSFDTLSLHKNKFEYTVKGNVKHFYVKRKKFKLNQTEIQIIVAALLEKFWLWLLSLNTI